MDLRKNGKALPPTTDTPFVNIVIKPELANPNNPNGVVISTNMRDPSGKQPQTAIIMLLSEAIHILARSMENAAPVSATIVMPDGAPAPLPSAPTPQG